MEMRNLGMFFNKKDKSEILLDTDNAFPKMNIIQLEALLVETRMELDKRTGTNTTFKFKSRI
jgi:hypothetical protein